MNNALLRGGVNQLRIQGFFFVEQLYFWIVEILLANVALIALDSHLGATSNVCRSGCASSVLV